MESYAELTVNGLTLRGVVHRPEAVTRNSDMAYTGVRASIENAAQTSVRANIENAARIGAKTPVVIMFHGFTGNKMEHRFMFVRMARKLAEVGIGCVRFDFGGSGESDGEFADMTFSREVAEAKAILEYAKQIDWVDRERISLLGFSMGGAVATQVAAALPSDIHKLCLWAPAGNINRIAERNFEVSPARQDGSIDLGGLVLGRAFLDDLKDRDLYEGVTAFAGPVCIVHGEKDAAVPIEYGKKFYEVFGASRAEFYQIEGADHGFSALDWRDKLYAASLRFLQA